MHRAQSNDVETRRQPTVRAPWNSPSVTELPRLTELTLQTGGGIPGGGGTGGGGSTVF
jgi:hypothetical protein